MVENTTKEVISSSISDQELGISDMTSNEELLIIKNLKKPKLIINDYWYVCNMKWWNQWCQFTNYKENNEEEEEEKQQQQQQQQQQEDIEMPPKIDNTSIQGNCRLSLKLNLTENVDYILIHQERWNRLYQWYGGGPLFKRVVCNIGTKEKPQLEIELYPILLHPCYTDMKGNFDRNSCQNILCSRYAKVLDLLISLKPPESLGMLETANEKIKNRRIWVATTDKINECKEEKERERNDDDEKEKEEKTQQITQEEEEEEENPEMVLLKHRFYDKSLEEWLISINETDFTLVCGSLSINEGGHTLPMLLLEQRKEESEPWPRERFEGDWRKQIEINDKVDAVDTMKKWYESTIMDMKVEGGKTLIFVHYDGWSNKWDRWLDLSDENYIAPRHTHTFGPYCPKPKVSYDQRYCSASSTSGGYYSGKSEQGKPKQRGVVGLKNLGNTCFMNSTLQCLANSPILTPFFVSEQYLTDINKKNPLGWKGKIAMEYGKLLKQIWNDEYKIVSPKTFKHVIGEFAPRFHGYSQQDSSEFLFFLLDGLHEDLNRIYVKPMTSKLISDGRSDIEVSKDAWEIHQLRNSSIIVDHLQGQLKSTVICPVCDKVNITFDPFMFLSVPLPIVREKIIQVKLIFANNNNDMKLRQPTLYSLVLPSMGTILDMFTELSKITNIPVSKFIAVDVFRHSIYCILDVNYLLPDIRPIDNFYILEVPNAQYSNIVANPNPNPTVANPNPSPNNKNEMKHSQIEEEEEEEIVTTETITETVVLKITNYILHSNPFYYPGNIYMKEYSRNPFAIPLLVAIPIQTDSNENDDNTIETTPASSSSSSNTDDDGDDDDELNHSMSTISITAGEIRSRIHQVTSPFIQNFHLEHADPYKIYIVNNVNGQTCGICNSNTLCEGCILSEDDNEYLKLPNGNDLTSISFLLEWQSIEYFNMNIFLKPISYNSNSINSRQQLVKKNKNTLELYDCLDAFATKEVLGMSDAWLCPVCKELRQATKQLQLYSIPKVLIIHLKRFQYSQRYREKIDCMVKFPINGLDLSECLASSSPQVINKIPVIYDLFAISNHMGTLGRGHYTAYAKNVIDNNWYKFDDAGTCQVTNLNDLVTPAAYVLFYQLRGIDTGSKDMTKED